jgi:hypothetical protein
LIDTNALTGRGKTKGAAVPAFMLVLWGEVIVGERREEKPINREVFQTSNYIY